MARYFLTENVGRDVLDADKRRIQFTELVYMGPTNSTWGYVEADDELAKILTEAPGIIEISEDDLQVYLAQAAKKRPRSNIVDLTPNQGLPTEFKGGTAPAVTREAPETDAPAPAKVESLDSVLATKPVKGGRK